MSHALPALLLGSCTILWLLLVPLGLPGLWVMVAGISAHADVRRVAPVGVGRPRRRDRRRRAGRARADRRERDRRVPRLVRRRGAVRVFAVPHNGGGGA